MEVSELYETLMNIRRAPEPPVVDAPIKLKNIWWPVERAANLAIKAWPEFFHEESE
jgi:hypothetical protein